MDGAKLRELRKKLGLSQTAFGSKIHASQSQIRDWEQNLYKIPTWAEENIRREFLEDKSLAQRMELDDETAKLGARLMEFLKSATRRDKEFLRDVLRYIRTARTKK